MDGSRVSNFSIDRILGPEVGPSSQKAPGSFQNVGYFQEIPCGNRRPLAPVPVYPYQAVGYGNGFFPFGPGFHHADFSLYPNCFSQDAALQQLAGHHGYQQAEVWAQAQQQRQRTRMRTVFTDSQTKQLEALFELTDYPAVEARAEVARSTGLSEETIRVWFKNRRARRKRQHSGSKVRSPSPPRKETPENVFSSFL